AAAALLAGGLVLFNNHILPETNHALANLMVDVGRKRPTTQISEGVFIDGFEGYNIFVEKVNNRTNEIRGVKIYQLNSSARPTTSWSPSPPSPGPSLRPAPPKRSPPRNLPPPTSTRSRWTCSRCARSKWTPGTGGSTASRSRSRTSFRPRTERPHVSTPFPW